MRASRCSRAGARESGRRRRSTTAGGRSGSPARVLLCPPPMEHPDLAQVAAVGGALGSVLVLLARGRLVLLAGLVVLTAAEAGLALSLGAGPLGELSAATGAGAAAIGALLVGLAATALARRPALVP